ncbi:MAG: hypothetical protein ACXWV5_10430 [Flavitalea sp.]
MNIFLLVPGIFVSAAAAIVYNFLLSLLNSPYQFLLHAAVYGLVAYLMFFLNIRPEILLSIGSFVILRIFCMKKRTHELFLIRKETTPHD